MSRMCKLAVIVDTFPRWSERFIARECRALLKCDVDLSIFCLHAGPMLPDGEREWDGLIERRIVLPRCLVPSLRPEHHLPRHVRDRRDRVRDVLGRMAYTKVRCAESLTDLLRADGYTHVHAHFANVPSTIGWMAAMEIGLPLTLSVHARDLFVEAQLLADKAADARAIFCCNPKAEAFLKKTVPNANVIHMPHGLPLELFKRPTPPPPPASFHFLAAGRFVEKKGFLDALEALASPEILAQSWTATLLGEGPLKSKLAATIKRLKLGVRIEIKEPALGAALRDEFMRSSVFIAPYKETADGDSDGVPNAVLEAMAWGVPVIARGAAVLDERIVFPATGEKAPESLAREFERVLNDPAQLRERAEVAKKWVEGKFNSDSNIGPLLEIMKA